MKKRYIYHVARYVPRAWAGEQVNLGVIIGNDEEGFRAKATNDPTRCKCISRESSLWDNENYRASVLGYAYNVAEESQVSEERLRARVASMGNAMSCVQLSSQSVTLEYNIEAGLQSVYEMFVA